MGWIERVVFYVTLTGSWGNDATEALFDSYFY